MKKTLFLATATLLFSGMASRVCAQDAQAVIDRYEQAVGFERVDMEKTAVMTRLKVSAMGMEIPCTTIVAPQGRTRVEMTVNGQKMEIVISEGKGWMSVPGAGVQEIPQEQLSQMSGQYDILSSLKWDKSQYDFTLLPQAQENGKNYDVVCATPKDPSGVTQVEIYFDHLTGLAAFMDSQVDAGGQKVTVRNTFSKYKTSESGLKYPSEIKASMNGAPVSSVVVEALTVNYPVTDEMFAQPK